MKLTLFSLFLFIISISYGQNEISGVITNEKNTPVEFASIKLLSTQDSSVTGGAYTLLSGTYSIQNVSNGEYYMVINYPGYLTDTVSGIVMTGSNIDMGTVALSLDKALELEDAVVVGNLDVLKAGIDKKVYDVGNDVSTRGGTVNDVLKNIPSVDVDQDGNISLRGDGNVTILVDGRPSGLVLGDGQNLLGSLPANSIERVEVVTNPSAKYDPDGTAGIINVVMKKNKLRGFNGLLSATVGTGDMYEGNVALSYRNERVNSYVNYSYSTRKGFRNYKSDLIREITSDSTIHLSQSREGTHTRNGNTVVVGSDFYLGERNVIGVTGTVSLSEQVRTGDLENVLYGNDIAVDRWDRNAIDPQQRTNLDLGLNYKRDFKSEKGSWSTSAGHSVGDRFSQGFYEEIYYTSAGLPSNVSNLNQRLDNTQNNTVTTAQTDIEYLIKEKAIRLETGAKMILNNQTISTFSETMDTLTGSYLEDTIANFDFTYFGSVYSVYGIFGQQLKKFKYQVGLRGEYAQQVPRLLSTGEDYSTDFLNLFPSGHVRYDLKKKSELSFSYSRRINRPRSRQLNPFTNYSDPFNQRSGNPQLIPEFINSFDLGYSYSDQKITFTSSVFYRHTTGVINRVKIYRDDNTAVVTYGNIDESQSTGLELIFLYRPFKWMKNSLTVNGNHINYTNNTTVSDWNNSGYNYSANYIGTVDFWKKTASFQVNANYRSPRITPQGKVQPRGSLDLSVEKRFLDKKLSTSFRVTDVFNTRGFVIDLDQVGIQQDGEYKWLTRRFILTVSYKFGKYDVKVPRRNGGGGGGGMD